MARMLGKYEMPFCTGPSCRCVSYGPDCIAKCTTKKAQRRYERRQWMREYLEDAYDFEELRWNSGWLFFGVFADLYEKHWGEDFAEAYVAFGVTSSGWPVRRTP